MYEKEEKWRKGEGADKMEGRTNATTGSPFIL